MKPPFTEITARDANHALHFFQQGGYEGGHFIDTLLKAASYADQANLERLIVAFPGPIAAFQLGSRISGGIALLRKIASG